jgi:hypothetical protein
MLKYYGDLRVVERHWPTLRAYQDKLFQAAQDGANWFALKPP